MKLEVGMYCYHKNNRKYGIGKILKIEKNNNCLVDYNIHIGLVSCGNLVASHNIIDLIEAGDVVVDNSGRKLEVNLIRVWNDEKEIICNDYNLDDSALTLHNGGIFKVLTKEQFENNCYKIGDE